MRFDRWFLMIAIVLGTVAVPFGSTVSAQDDDPAANKDESEKKEKADPFAVPEDASVDELLEFIQTVKGKRGRTLQTMMKSASAVVEGTQAIRKLDDVDKDVEMQAIEEEIAALAFLSRYDRENDREAQLQQLIDSLLNDSRPEFQAVGKLQNLSQKVNSLRGKSADAMAAVFNDFKDLAKSMPFDRKLYSVGSSLARTIGYADEPELGARVYEFMAEQMSESDDEQLQSRAERMVGAARRMRLPGNPIEIIGTTAKGEPLDWDSYRGKVVLVDFWASWCGPCRAEIPNMKRNLEAYGDKGFAILGVNLDTKREAYEKYINDNDLSWENLMSDNPEEMGWNNPMSTYYGVSGIPTAILVDQKGNVVSLSARGKELDRLLLEMLGEPEEPKGEDSDETEAEAADDDK